MWKGLWGAHFPVVGPWLLQHDVFQIRLPGEQQIPQGDCFVRQGTGSLQWTSRGCQMAVKMGSRLIHFSGGQHHAPFVEEFFGVNEVFLLPVEIGKHAVSLNKE